MKTSKMIKALSAIAIIAVIAVAVIIGGSRMSNESKPHAASVKSAKPAPKPTPKPAPEREAKPAAEPALDLAKIKPNELGRIMILEYHLIGRPEGEWRRTPENFRKDLEQLYEEGYYPVSIHDVVGNRISVPAGKTPVVLTFDDSSPGQFRYIESGGKVTIDPESAVGIMESFSRQHPDFPMKAIFYVLPAVEPIHRIFGQPEYMAQKLKYIVEKGMDIGNHTYWHQNLGKASKEEAIKQLALAQKAVEDMVPGYRLRSLSLPFGVKPEDYSIVKKGIHEEVSYENESVVLVTGGPAPSPVSPKFDPYNLPRIQAGDTAWGPGKTIEYFKKHPEERYVSDGDPNIITIPAALKGAVNSAALKGKTLRTY